jgi:hypothetical protein
MKIRPRSTAAMILARLTLACLFAALPSLTAAQTPNAVTILTQPEQTVAGQNITPVGVSPEVSGPRVEVRDTLNNPLPGAAVTVSLNIGSFASGTETVTTGVDGTAYFSDLKINTAGSGYTLTFTVAPGVSATSSQFPVVPAPPARADVSTQPVTTVYGSPVGGSPAVTLYDAFDNPVRQGYNITASLNSGVFKSGSTATVATDINGVAVFSNLVPDAVGTGYTLTFNPAPAGVTNVNSAAFDITAKPLTVGGSFTVTNKPYDGTTAATIDTNSLVLETLVSGDTVTLSSITANFAQANAGTVILVSLSAPALGGADAANYTVTAAGAPTTTADITKAPLTITGSFTADDKIYDGTTVATIAVPNTLALAGVVGSEDVTLNAVANFAQAAVGTDISVNLSSSTIGGTANLANYSFSTTGAPTTTADITKATLTIGGSFTARNKVYDGNTSAAIATDSLLLVGVIGSDAVALNKTANFTQSNTGTGLIVNLLSSTLGGAAAGNYTLSFAGAPTATADITAQPLTITGTFTVDNKTYDGTTAAAFKTETLSLVGLVGSETVTFNKVATFSQAAPGTILPVGLDDSTISGPASGNYELSFAGAPTTTADITARLVTISGSFTAADKSYDGTTAATITANSLTLVGLAPGDTTTTLNAVANFPQSGVGNDLTVSLLDSTLSGAAAGSYTLSFNGAPTTKADITAKELTVGGGFTANDKIYDGNTDATFETDNLQLVGVVTGDAVTLIDKQIDFATKNIGMQTVSLTAADLGGADEANYSLSLAGAPTTTAEITALQLTIGGSFTAQNKAYDGNTTATIDPDGLTLLTPVAGDVVNLAAVTAEFGQANVGTGITVSITGASLGGAGAGNYTVSTAGAPTTTADITALTLTIGGSFTASNKVYDGTTAATIDATGLLLVGTIVSGDVVTLDAVGTFAQSDVGNGITVSLTSSTLAGAAADNYTLDTTGAPTTTADINAKDLTIQIGNSSVEAGQGVADLNPTPTVTMTGLVPTDTEAEVSGDPVVYTSVVLPATTTAGDYPGDLGVATNGTKASNYNITQDKGDLKITAAAAANIAITSEPVTTTAGLVLQGLAGAPSVEVTDAYGNAKDGFAVSVALNGASFYGGTTTVTTDITGAATFGDLVIRKSGTGYYLTFSGTGVPSADSAEFSIIAATARGLSIVQQPGDRQAGQEFAPAPAVQLTDEFGNPVLVGPYNITASLHPTATIIGAITRSTSSLDGTATFAGMSVRKAGTYTMKFTPGAAGVSAVISDSFVISAQLDSASISLTTQPGNTVAGVAIDPAPVALVQDQYLNPVTGYLVTATLNGGSFAPAATATATTGADGSASFGNLVINAAKNGYTLGFGFAQASPYGTQNVTSAVFDVTHAALDKFDFGTVGNQTAGVSFNLAITAQDEFGNTVTDFNGTANLSLNQNTFASGAGATGNFVNGVLASQAVTINTAASGYQITATSGAIDGKSNVFEVSPAAAASLTLSGPSTVVAGETSTAFTLTVKDALGNNTPVNASTTFTLTTSRESGTATFTPASLVLAGGASSGTFTYRNTKVGAGSHVLTASFASGDAGLTGDTAQATITVTPAAAAKLAISTQPSATAQAGATFSQQPVVRLLDQYDNNVLQPGVAVSAAIASGGPELLGTTPITTDANGVATFTNLAIGGLTGSRTLVFASSGLTSATSTAIAVSEGVPGRLTVVTEPSQTKAGEAINPAPSVRLTDAYENILAGQTVQVALTPGSAGSFVSSTTSAVTDASGVATFANLKIDKAYSPYQLEFRIGTVTVLSRQFAVIGGTPTRLEMVQQPPTGTAGKALDPAPSIKAFDEFNNGVADIRVVVTLNGGSFATGSETELRTGLDGVASFAGLKINTAKTGYTVTFNTFVAGTPSVTSAAFEVKPDYDGAVVTVTTQPGTTTAGNAVSGPPTVTVKDQFNNNVSDKDISVTLNTGSFAGGSTTTVKTNVSGVAAFSSLRINGAGSYTLTFRLDGHAAAVTSNAFTVNPAAAAKFVMVTQPSPTASAGVAFATQPAVRLQDNFGNNVSLSGRTVTASVATGSGTLAGTLTATTNASGIATFATLRIDGATGSRTLRFSSSGVTAVDSQAVVVGPGTATGLSITRQPLQSVAGEPILSTAGASLAVRATDAFGNNVPGVSVTPEPNGFFFAGPATAAVTDSAGLATFDTLSTTEVGLSFTIAFKAAALAATSAEFNVVPATPASLVVLQQPLSGVVDSPLRPAPKVQLTDRFGNPTTSATPYNIGVTISNSSFTGGSDTRVMTTADGTAIFDNLVPAEEGTGVVLHFDIDGKPVASSSPFNILGSDQDPEAVMFVLLEGSQEDLLAGEERPLTVTLLNAQGEAITSGPASTGSVMFSQLEGTGGTVTGLGSVPASAGVATLTIRGAEPGEVVISATYDGMASEPLQFTVTGVEARIISFQSSAGGPVTMAAGAEAPAYATYELTFEVTPGANYEVQFLETLGSPWQTVLTGKSDAAELTVELPVSPTQRHGFWRVRAGLLPGSAEAN